MSTWEQYHTGTLYLGYFNGPEEGITTLVLAFGYTYFSGFELWNQSFKELFAITDPTIPDFELKLGFAVCAGIPVLITAVYTYVSNISSQ
jgi:ethanolaminephosphotransferase